LEAAMRRTAGTEAGAIQGIPLATSTEDKEDSIHGLAVIDTRSMAPARVRLPQRE
jgi:hypothetical protein